MVVELPVYRTPRSFFAFDEIDWVCSDQLKSAVKIIWIEPESDLEMFPVHYNTLILITESGCILAWLFLGYGDPTSESFQWQTSNLKLKRGWYALLQVHAAV
jgi:hypothetical protein